MYLVAIITSNTPGAGQLVLLGVSITLFIVGGILSVLRLRAATPQRAERYRIGAKALAYFGVCCALAVLIYLIVNHRLRSKRALLSGPNLGSLERLEHLTLESVSLGFALLTIGAVTGINEMVKGKQTSPTKLVLTAAVWVVYAVVLHAPINPSFRGRKAAVLSVVGFVLTIGTMLAVLVTSGRN